MLCSLLVPEILTVRKVQHLRIISVMLLSQARIPPHGKLTQLFTLWPAGDSSNFVTYSGETHGIRDPGQGTV
jgi:hypothetical protein